MKLLKDTLKKFILFLFCPGVIFLVIAASCIAGAWFNSKSTLSATTSMSLSYPEAADGLTPNGTRYNTNELLDDELLQNTIDNLGIGSYITAEELSEDISIEPARQSGGDKEHYVCTTWNISISLKEEIPHMPAKTILDVYCQKYKESFLETYSERWAATDLSSDTLLSDEPYVQILRFSTQAEELDTYLTKRVNESEGQNTAVDGTDFSSLSRQVKNILDYETENLKAVILRDGISSDKTLFTNTLAYKLRLDKKTYDTQMAYYDANNLGISQYDESMSAVVMIPTVDESNEFYMSKTKTALDELASSADTSLEEATSYNSEMESTKYLSSQMQNGKSGNTKTVEGSIETIEKELSDIATKLAAVDKNYIRHKTQDYIQFVDANGSFSQNIGLKKIVVIDGIVIALLFALHISAEDREKSRNRKGGR